MTAGLAKPALRSVARAAVVSDLHLTPDDSEALERFLGFARKLPGRVDALWILGDLFEAYVGSKHLRVPGYRALVHALDALAGNGVAVTCLRGNRDFLLDDGFTRATGARVAGDEDSFESGGKRILCVHGDLFCVRDLEYQAMRRRIRSPLVRAAAKALPLPVLLSFARKLRKTSTEAIAMKTPVEMGIVDSEVEARLREGFDVVICGHVHDPRRTALAGGELVVLPAWPSAPGALWIDKGVLRFEGAA